jgi:hypothetical protein
MEPAGRVPVSGLWVPAAPREASRELPAGRLDTALGARQLDVAAAAAMSLPEEFLPVVNGLSLGKPDATASRLLDMSPRTYSRRVAEFLTYLEVETRFQAGVVVAHRWLLTADPLTH